MARSCGAEQLGLVEAESDAAHPRKGFSSFGKARYGTALSPPMSSVRMISGRPFSARVTRADTPRICLLFFARRRVAFQEQELGAQQADTLPTGVDRRRGVDGVANIRDDFDPVSVAGLRRLHRGRELFPAALGASGDLLAGAGDFRLVRVAAEHAASAVEQDLGAVVEVQGRFIHAADRGDAERAGDDRDVAGGAAAGGAEAQDAGAVDRGDVGGRQILGDQNGILRNFDLLLLDAGEQAEDTPADIADVGGALA